MKYLAAIVLVGAIGLAGRWDMQEAERQAEQYRDMVCAGHWPDYENRKPECDR